jgi:PAS domain S-box-containing protein
MYGGSVNFWGKHIATGRPIMDEAFVASINVGNFVYAGYTAIVSVWHLIEEGETFDKVLNESEKYLSFARESRNEVVYQMVRDYDQFLLCLKGLTDGVTSFNDNTFNEAKCIEVFINGKYVPGVAFHYIMKQNAAFINRQYNEALEYALKAEEMKLAVMNLAIQATHHFYHALTLTALYPKVDAVTQQEFSEMLEEMLKKYKHWAGNCPENFQNRYALISAEVSRIQGKDLDAMYLYEEAIRSAKENGFIQQEAIANELAGQFYKARGFEKIAESYLRDAYSCFKHWGADGKVRQLEEIYPFLKERRLSLTTTLGGLSVEQIDFLAIIKASQTISGQIDVEKLISDLMRIVLEQTGAHYACLLLDHEDHLTLDSIAKNVHNEFNVEVYNNRLPGEDNLPLSIVQYVKRTREKIIIEDVSLPHLFYSDDYLLYNHPKSIACLPILKQTELLGFLYLQNNLFTRAFSMDKISVLELLSSQAAISIENATLFKELTLSRQQFQDLMENSPAVIFIKKPDGEYIFINRKFEKIFHISRAEVVGKTDYELWPEELADMVRANDKKVLESLEPMIFEETIPQDDGYHTYISVKFPLMDMTGIPYATCGIATDITDRKRAEEEIRQINRELIKTNTDLDNFIYTASHNLRGPVSTIEGLINLLDLNLYKEEELKDLIGMLKTSLVKFKDAVSDLTEISKVQKLIEKEDVDLIDVNQMIEEMKTDMEDMIKESGAEIEVNLSAAKVIRFSKEYFKRIIYNLLSNSIKFRSADRRLEIRISTAISHKFIILCISDNATGISKMIQNKIFGMFTKGHEYTTGSGIGLYIVKRIIENEGGKIEFTSEEGKGSTFKVYFKK